MQVQRSNASSRKRSRPRPGAEPEKNACADQYERQAGQPALPFAGLVPQAAQDELVTRGDLGTAREVLPQALGLLCVHLGPAPSHILLERPQTDELRPRALDVVQCFAARRALE